MKNRMGKYMRPRNLIERVEALEGTIERLFKHIEVVKKQSQEIIEQGEQLMKLFKKD